MIVGIPHDQIDQWWPLVHPFVARGLAYADGKYTPDDIRAGLIERQYQLWMANTLDAICITQIIDYPQKRICLVFLVAGKNINNWLAEADAVLCAWAKEKGCQAIEGYARPGWARVLPNTKRLHVVLGREL